MDHETLATSSLDVRHALYLQGGGLLGGVSFTLDTHEQTVHDRDSVGDASAAKWPGLRGVKPHPLLLEHLVQRCLDLPLWRGHGQAANSQKPLHGQNLHSPLGFAGQLPVSTDFSTRRMRDMSRVHIASLCSTR